jgi:hypothetical protein
MEILHCDQNLLKLVDSLFFIDQVGAMPSLRDRLAHAQYEFNRSNGDREWRRRNPFSVPNQFGDLAARLTGLPVEPCRQAAQARLNPTWSQVAIAEIVDFVDELRDVRRTFDDSESAEKSPKEQNVPSGNPRQFCRGAPGAVSIMPSRRKVGAA